MQKYIFRILPVCIIMIFIIGNISYVNAKETVEYYTSLTKTLSDSTKQDLAYKEDYEDEAQMMKIEKISEHKNINESVMADDIVNSSIFVGTIYKQPKKEDSASAGKSLDDSINDADDFIQGGEVKYGNGLADVSNTIYNILVTVGVIVAVLIGAILGIKLMASGIEGKVEAKQLLVPYVVGCVIIFGGFGIWKLIVTILQKV